MNVEEALAYADEGVNEAEIVLALAVRALRAENERLREVERLRLAMWHRAVDVQDWCQDQASESAAWRAATFIRNGAGPGVDARKDVLGEEES